LQVTFLGTSSGVPTLTRNVSAMVLKPPQRSDLWLFDCGEGTQHQFIRSNLKLSQIKKIFITHMHGDHVYGLPGLLASIGLAGGSRSSSKRIRHNPNDCLYGVPSPGKVRDLITENIQSDTGVEHLKNIKELLKTQNEED